MSWRRLLFLGLVFGVAGLAYGAWQESRDRRVRRRLVELERD